MYSQLYINGIDQIRADHYIFNVRLDKYQVLVRKITVGYRHSFFQKFKMAPNKRATLNLSTFPSNVKAKIANLKVQYGKPNLTKVY